MALVPGATLDVDVPGLGLHAVGQDALSAGSGWRMQQLQT